jgi:hypothetical protein
LGLAKFSEAHRALKDKKQLNLDSIIEGTDYVYTPHHSFMFGTSDLARDSQCGSGSR